MSDWMFNLCVAAVVVMATGVLGGHLYVTTKEKPACERRGGMYVKSAHLCLRKDVVVELP